MIKGIKTKTKMDRIGSKHKPILGSQGSSFDFNSDFRFTAGLSTSQAHSPHQYIMQNLTLLLVRGLDGSAGRLNLFCFFINNFGLWRFSQIHLTFCSN